MTEKSTLTDLTDFGEDADPFATGDIFANRELVRVGHIPDRDKIVGRKNEINFVGQALGPAIEGGPPENITVMGKTGTGKSLVTRFMAEEAEKRAELNDVNLIYVYQDCARMRSATETIRQIAAKVRDRFESDVSIPTKGISQNKYFNRLWKILGENGVDSLVIILDEIDKLDSEKDRDDDDDELLMALSRAEEKQDTDTYIGIMCTSNKVDWRKEVDQRVDSSLSDQKKVFNPYKPKELRDILNARTDAFNEGVLADDVIPKIAALAAREHGDARKAVDMLRYSGKIAEKQNADEVAEEHLDAAKLEAEADRFRELIAGSTPHAKYVLRALAAITKDDHVQPDKKTGGYSKTQIYSVYKKICDDEKSNAFKWDSVSRLLKEQSFLGVTESHYTGGGRGRGSYRTHKLIRDPDIVMKALE